jgi:hypothetical protein
MLEARHRTIRGHEQEATTMAFAQQVERAHPRLSTPNFRPIEYLAVLAVLVVVAFATIALIRFDPVAGVSPEVLASGRQWEAERRVQLGYLGADEQSGLDWEEQRRQQRGEIR